MEKILKRGRRLLYVQQNSLLTASVVIMLTITFSRLLGLIRMRTLFHFFSSSEVTLYLAAFKLPDLWFEVLVIASLSSAFIPVFASYLGKNKTRQAWELASSVLVVSFLGFTVFALIVLMSADQLYALIAAGLPAADISTIANFSRWILVGEAFFALSYVFTGILESNQRFLAPALAPVLYNSGIILGVVFLAPTLGLKSAVIGAVFGAFLHFAIQLPIALHLGFRLRYFKFFHPGLLKMFKLSLPRIAELSVFQTRGFFDLFLASHISRSAYGLLRSADMLQGALVGLFGLAIAKAALPMMARQFAGHDIDGFRRTFVSSFNAILFLTVPASAFIIVLRTPIVRLAFGAEQFDWPDTVETGYALSAFALAVISYALVLVLTRSFYAIHETLLPMKIAFITTVINIIVAFFLVFILNISVWGIAISFSVATAIQALILFLFLYRRIRFSFRLVLIPFLKILIAAAGSGTVMFFLLKIFDRSVWDKRLSFLGKMGFGPPTSFETFILDTRYTINLIILTLLVSIVGVAVYILLTYLLKVQELGIIMNFLKRRPQILAKLSSSTASDEAVSSAHTNGR